MAQNELNELINCGAIVIKALSAKKGKGQGMFRRKFNASEGFTSELLKRLAITPGSNTFDAQQKIYNERIRDTKPIIPRLVVNECGRLATVSYSKQKQY